MTPDGPAPVILERGRDLEAIMSEKLIEALRELNLRPGEAFTVQVDGRELEIHEKEEPGTLVPDGFGMFYAPNTPDPPGGFIVKATPGKLPLPDPPNLEDLAPGDLPADES